MLLEVGGEGSKLWVRLKPSTLCLCRLPANGGPQLPFYKFPHVSSVAAACPGCRREALGPQGKLRSVPAALHSELAQPDGDMTLEQPTPALFGVWAEQIKSAHFLIRKTLELEVLKFSCSVIFLSLLTPCTRGQ